MRRVPSLWRPTLLAVPTLTRTTDASKSGASSILGGFALCVRTAAPSLIESSRTVAATSKSPVDAGCQSRVSKGWSPTWSSWLASTAAACATLPPFTSVPAALAPCWCCWCWTTWFCPLRRQPQVQRQIHGADSHSTEPKVPQGE